MDFEGLTKDRKPCTPRRSAKERDQGLQTSFLWVPTTSRDFFWVRVWFALKRNILGFLGWMLGSKQGTVCCGPGSLRKVLGVPYTNGFLLSAPKQNAKTLKIVAEFELSMVFSPKLLAVEPEIWTWKFWSPCTGLKYTSLYTIYEYIWLFVTCFSNIV